LTFPHSALMLLNRRPQTPVERRGRPLTATTPPPALWDTKDLAEFLGVSVRTIEAWRLKGAGPEAMRIGKHLRWDPAVVMTWARGQSDSRRSATA